MVYDDPARVRLFDVMRARKGAPVSGWPGAEVTQKLAAEVDELVKGSRECILLGHKQKLQGAMDTLRPIAGGAPGGKLWSDGVSNEWPAIQEACCDDPGEDGWLGVEVLFGACEQGS